MKRILVLLTIILALFIYSCDTTESSFDDTLPEQLTLSLSASPDEGGTLTPAEIEYVKGQEVQIEAVSSDGFIFERWTGDFESETNPATLVMTENKSVTALFKEISSLIAIETTGEGTIETDFDGQTVSLYAVPSDGWTFIRWEGDLSGSENPESLFLDEDKSVTAHFEQRFDLSVTIDGSGNVEIDPVKEFYNHGDTVTFTATPEPGYRFSHWEGDLSGSENPIQTTMDRDKSATAVFVWCILC
ncbi:hypothetical protein DYD21_03860 [Rhodohalobacter sp. SW132]|uniref:InlB B-repeat-containing protein n=1 Tax=Rhodohalobacter sp. SW132 TaxID=2293433 RepID=UPI000E224602|nr:hypothetical protein [Rhodohalobacter sp. SW132]REL39102.1 hypothetical protein DYD21_03860 [Rhodohalobacter sp. SW132]